MKTALNKSYVAKILIFLAVAQLQTAWAAIEADPAPPRTPHWNADAVARVEARLARTLNEEEIRLLDLGERMIDDGRAVASRDLAPVNFGKAMAICAGLNVAVIGKYVGLVCYDWGSGRALTISGVDWVGAMATAGATVVVLSGPNINDPSSYRGTYVNPVGISGAFVGGIGGMKYQGKERVIAAEDMFADHGGPIDDSYSLLLLSAYAGVGGSLDLGRGSAVVN